MKCPRCDFKLKTGALYCGRCGLARPRDEHAVDPLLGATLGGRHRVERRIGAGGMGTVYQGTDVRLGQPVAIKVLHERFTRDPQILPRFENEALACGRLIHPNLVTLHDYGQDKGLAYAVMEFCPGISLSHLLRRHERLSVPLAVELVVQVGQALQVVHDGEVVHRDLKPDNILLVEVRPGHYHVKLLDFGIAKYLDEEGPALTQAGMVFGTPEYMAPEQAKGEPVDPRADIYALGVILFELLTGQVPFSGKNRMNLMHKHAHDTPPELDAVSPVPLPEDLCEVVMMCLSKDPADRPQSALELVDALEAALAESPSVEVGEPILASQLTPPQGPAVAMSPPPAQLTASSMAPVTTWALPGRGPLGVAAGLLCVMIAGAAWLGAPAPESGAPESGAPKAAISESAASKSAASRSEAAAPAAPEPNTEAPAAHPGPQGPGDLLVWVDPAKPEAPNERTADPPAPEPEIEPSESPKTDTPAIEVAEPPPSAADQAAERRRLAERHAQQLVQDARKLMKFGKLDDAARAVKQALKSAPDFASALALQDQLDQIRSGLILGRQLFEDGDCKRAVEILSPVLESAPGAPGVSHIINQCRQMMPPQKL